MRIFLNLVIVLIFLILTPSFAKITQSGDQSVIITNDTGLQLRLTAYGSKIIRAQYAQQTESFLPDNHYEMVVSHNWEGEIKASKKRKQYIITLKGNLNFNVLVNRETLALDYQIAGASALKQQKGFVANNSSQLINFEYDNTEHFTGLGHGYFGRADSVDLKGQKLGRNYGSDQSEQAPLIVPFYMSSKGYGVFLNSTFENFFNFGENKTYEMGINTLGYKAQMDYFFILGPSLKEVLHNYVTLTGKPRLPQKSVFGLQLSDKVHDHNSKTPSDENWWKNTITKHIQSGFPIDHLVNDNRWRAGGGKRCESYIEWDKGRYPDPSKYQEWLNDKGLTSTIDFNRCIGQYSEGWQFDFNIPISEKVNFKESAPDLTNSEFRKWFWDILYKKSLNPELKYPGDGLWIDEFDEMGEASKHSILANGRSSAEMRNYWFFLIAKALVKDGWDKQIGESKRPYVWVRGMTAGAQRYATLWSGDIQPNHDDMRKQIRGMQLAGLSGFPFWGHDAGGFYDWDKRKGPNEQLYQQWAMGMGIFSPIWKPHGMGASRWPLDRPIPSQAIAKKYAHLRYSLMPYTYTFAHHAHETGEPLVRAMLLDYGGQEKAWKADLQYLWGKDLLIAPSCKKDNSSEVWLPEGGWYNYWNEKFYPNEIELISNNVRTEYPIFVKSGAIIPTTKPAMNVNKMVQNEITIHVYTGADGSFTLYEDDGITEKFRTKEEFRLTDMEYDNQSKQLTIQPSKGIYNQAYDSRIYSFIFHGITKDSKVLVNSFECHNTTFDTSKNILSVHLGRFSIDESVVVKLE